MDLDILERRQQDRLAHLHELQALIDMRQREIDNLRAQGTTNTVLRPRAL